MQNNYISKDSYSASNLGGADKEKKIIKDSNLMFMTEAERLKYWRVKPSGITGKGVVIPNKGLAYVENS